MFGSQPAYPEKLLHKKESLQNQLINIRVELSQATTVGNHGNQSLPGEPALPSPPRQGSPNPSSPQRARAGCSWGGTQTKTRALPCKETAGKSGCSPSSIHGTGELSTNYTCNRGHLFPWLLCLLPWRTRTLAAILVGQGRPSQLTAWVIARRAAAREHGPERSANLQRHSPSLCLFPFIPLSMARSGRAGG